VKRVLLLLVCLNISVVAARAAATGYQLEHLVFYQPGEVLEERLQDTSKLTDYIKRLQDACQRFFATTTTPETLDIVVAVRPGRQVRIWFVSSRQSTPDVTLRSLRRELEKVTPCDVSQGAIAFAIAGKVAGGEGKRRAGTPMPAEWQRAVDRKGNTEIPDGILDSVWPRR
jgi:hypothetical protein